MSVAPDPHDIFQCAVTEGKRRLEQSTIELISTGFIAGFTIVFGLVALGIAHAAAEPLVGEAVRIVDAFAFGIGLVFVVVGRAELFNENFFDPVAYAIEQEESWLLPELGRLWLGTFVFNLVGGVFLVLVLSVEGALPPGTGEALHTTATEIADRGIAGRFANAIAGGTLVALLSHLLVAVDSVGSRITVTYIVGVLLALGPFEHVIVTGLHLFFGMQFGSAIGVGSLVQIAVVSTAGNFVGGLGLVTFSHVGQASGTDESNS